MKLPEFALVLTTIFCLPGPVWPQSPQISGPVTHKEDVIYGRKFDLALTFDVFIPQKPNGAGIIHLANGGWHRAHDDPSTFAELLRRGYTVFRVVVSGEPKFTIPEEAADVDRAVRFIRFHAKDFGVDPHRLGITGTSSGGHLALLQAGAGDDGNPTSSDPIQQTSSRVQAAACFFPLTDFLNYGEPGKMQSGDLGPLAYHRSSFDFSQFDPQTRTFVKVADDAKRREILRQISPITHVTNDSPPTFIMHGDKDEVVPLQQSEEMAARLKAVGVPVKLVVRAGGGHPWPDFWRQDSPALADWFDQYLNAR